MEAWLFYISLWCGVYALVLQQVMKRKTWRSNLWINMAMNGLFWATASALMGMLLASYSERIDSMGLFAVVSGLVGFFIGAFKFYLKGRDPEIRDVILSDNLEWANTGFSAILLASLVMFFVIQAFKIPSGSMRMTFVEGDHLFVNKFIYGIPVPLSKKKLLPFRTIQKGDIVIFRFPTKDKDNQHYGKDFIKRVVAVGGETLQIVNKELYVNGQIVEEPFKQHVDPTVYVPPMEFDPADYQEKWEIGFFAGVGGNEIRDSFGPITVPQGKVFVMGDNRDRSFDSRFWGPLPLADIKGKALLLYWPVRRFRMVK